MGWGSPPSGTLRFKKIDGSFWNGETFRFADYIFIVFGGFLLLVVILTLLAVNCHRSDKNEYLTVSDSSSVSVDSTAIALKTQWTRQSVPTITREQVDSVKDKYEFRIDIKNLISKRLTVGVPYALSLQAKDNKDKKKSKVELKQIFTEQQQGVFKCDNEGVDISNDTLVAKKRRCNHFLLYDWR